MAAYNEGRIQIGTLKAASALSSNQFELVKLASATTVSVCAAITDVPIGVLVNTPTSGQAAEIVIFGVSKIKADGTIAAGNLLGTSADGQADAIAAGTDTTVYTIGQAIGTASAGELFTALINIANGRAA